ncbi:hypothetical protein E4U33_006585, partial [Claviceps sp. LM78 group G4]
LLACPSKLSPIALFPHIPASRFYLPQISLFTHLSTLLPSAGTTSTAPSHQSGVLDFFTDTLLDRTCSIRRDLSNHADCRYNLAGHGSISGPRYLSTTSAPPQHHFRTTSEPLQIRSPPLHRLGTPIAASRTRLPRYPTAVHLIISSFLVAFAPSTDTRLNAHYQFTIITHLSNPYCTLI